MMKLSLCFKFGCQLLLLAMPLSVVAATGENTTASILDATRLFKVFGSLLLVFASIFGMVFLLKKMNGLPSSNHKVVRVLGSARIGSREKIILMEAGGQQLLVGATPNNIRTLHVFDQPIEGLEETATAEPALTSGFAALLGASMPSGKKS